MLSDLAGRLARVNDRIAAAQLRGGHNRPVKIVAVTKTHPPDAILAAASSGITDIGENRVQEAASKFPSVPDGFKIYRRLIGHLQSNKINPAIDLFDCIDSIDSIKLAGKVGRKAVQLNRTVPVLLEVNTSGEESKNGFSVDNVDEMLNCFQVEGIIIDGLMTIGPLTNDESKIRKAFTVLRELKANLNQQLEEGVEKMNVLSMGMSGDYEIAVEEGSTMIRLGKVLFGPRQKYHQRA